MQAIEGFGPGIYLDVPDDLYHTKKLGVVNKSGLDQIERSPAHYRAWIQGQIFKTGPALDFGKGFHCYALEPNVFADRYVTEPDFGDCRYKTAKDTRDAWRSANMGKILLSQDAAATIKGMGDAVRAHPIAGKLLVGGNPEVTIVWNDEVTGVPCKSRADYYVPSRGLVVDLKTTMDASPAEFKRSVASYRYHVQDALYRSGFAALGKPISHFIFVAVEKTPPYGVAVYALDEEAIACGYKAARRNIDTLAECVRANTWPSYSDHIQTLQLPKWAA